MVPADRQCRTGIEVMSHRVAVRCTREVQGRDGDVAKFEADADVLEAGEDEGGVHGVAGKHNHRKVA